jgi:hypothetical protein
MVSEPSRSAIVRLLIFSKEETGMKVTIECPGYGRETKADWWRS